MVRGKYSRRSLESRFWDKVNKEGPIHPIHGKCWTWIGYKNHGGYGIIITENKKRHRASRISWELHHGPIGDLCVLHKCDNPSCVNPSHLFIGTRGDNARDRHAKGRSVSAVPKGTNAGQSNGQAKLTEDQVKLIRKVYKRRKRGCSSPALAARFGVTQTTISDIVNRKSWGNI